MNSIRQAARAGDTEAQHRLAILYAAGKGVPQDYVLSHLWSNLAVSGGYRHAARTRDRVTNVMTSAQINEAQELARDWAKRLAK